MSADDETPALAECMIEDDRWRASLVEPLAEQCVSSALRVVGVTATETPALSILFANDDALQALNARFRDKPTATNILSFPSAERGDAPITSEDVNDFLGDLAISFERVEEEARSAGRPLEHHLSHLIVHGALHLLGYDHENDGDADVMERLEVEALAALGLPDPYMEIGDLSAATME